MGIAPQNQHCRAAPALPLVLALVRCTRVYAASKPLTTPHETREQADACAP